MLMPDVHGHFFVHSNAAFRGILTNGGQRLVSSRSTAKKHTEDIIMQNRQNGSTGSNSGSSFDSFFNSNPSHSMGSASSGNQSASSANWNTEAASSIDTRIFPSCRMKCILKRCFLKNALFMPGILTIPRSNAWQKTLPGITAGILIRFTAI